MSNWLNKIAITKIPKVGPITARTLISYCGGVEAVFKTNKKALEKIPGIGQKLAEVILKKAYFRQAEKELTFLEKKQITPYFFLDEGYPKRLKPLDDAPLVLYYKGTADINHSRIVGIVGTRKPSATSVAICEELVTGLKRYNALVISGLAYGIDATAHRKSLNEGMETIGVLGHGLSKIYPAQNRRLAEQMLEQGGLLTEFTSDMGADAGHFPMRNRIVAGMCDALVVVETALKGGSMITAQYGNEYSKDVFAFPGRINDAHLEGCNHLIKTHQAALIESADDIGYILRWEEDHLHKDGKVIVQLTEEEQIIADLMKQQSDTMEIDALTANSPFNSSEVASLLLTMEFKGVVKALPGKRFLLLQ
ncbi:MAG: DNA-processing protein DprA [Bacteroidota bacterium]